MTDPALPAAAVLPQARRALLKKLAGGAAMGAVMKFGGVGLAFLVLLVLARRMEAEAYGVFAAGFSLATIAGFAATLGQHTAVLRFWPSLDEAHGRRSAAAALRSSLKLTALGALAVFALLSLAGLIAPRLGLYGGSALTLVLTGLMAAAFALSETAVAAMRAQGAVGLALGPRELGWRVLAIAGAFALTAPLGGNQALALMAVALLVVTAPQILLLLREALASPRTPASAEDAAAMRGSMLAFWGGGVVGPLTGHVGTIIVAAALGPVAAGAYFAADRIAKLLSIALIGVNQIVGPMIARSWRGGRKDEVRLLVLAGSAIAFVVAGIGFLAYWLLGRFALSLFDPAYVEAWGVLMILSAGQLVNTICGPNNFLLKMTGHERIYFTSVSLWGIFAIVTIYLASSNFDILGAAAATTSTIIGMNLTHTAVAMVSLYRKNDEF